MPGYTRYSPRQAPNQPPYRQVPHRQMPYRQAPYPPPYPVNYIISPEEQCQEPCERCEEEPCEQCGEDPCHGPDHGCEGPVGPTGPTGAAIYPNPLEPLKQIAELLHSHEGVCAYH